MLRPAAALVFSSAAFLLLASAAPISLGLTRSGAVQTLKERPAGPAYARSATPIPAPLVAPLDAAMPSLPSTKQALDAGVLIVVSKPSQMMFVFKDGEAWGSSPVSTGRRGYSTPAGVFPILQKKVRHRSTTYGNAPMPYMQRLTWRGVALHAGRVPGYPASHGCIRLPWEFARKLYGITDFTHTVVLVTNDPIRSAEQARTIGSGRAIVPMLVEAPAQAPRDRHNPAVQGKTQTIQLAAATTAERAGALWLQLRQRQPHLQALQHEILPATVHGRKVFRLRASGPDAHSLCSRLASGGIACFRI